MRSAIPAVIALGHVALAYELPANLKAIYDEHLVRNCHALHRVWESRLTFFQSGGCDNALSEEYNEGASYCGDIEGVIFLKGEDEYDNMDIDCDGANNTAGDCANDPSGQGQTAFKDTVEEYGIEDLDANLHSYVVFGNEDSFEPQDEGMEPLSVMAIVCNDQVVSIPPFLLTLNVLLLSLY